MQKAPGQLIQGHHQYPINRVTMCQEKEWEKEKDKEKETKEEHEEVTKRVLMQKMGMTQAKAAKLIAFRNHRKAAIWNTTLTQ